MKSRSGRAVGAASNGGRRSTTAVRSTGASDFLAGRRPANAVPVMVDSAMRLRAEGKCGVLW